MPALIDGDDGLPAEVVRPWVKEKHGFLCSYIDISRGVRAKWRDGAGSTYIELFSGPGRGFIKETGEFVDGSAIAAWRASCARNIPFSTIYIADQDGVRLQAATERLRRLNAPVVALHGRAVDVVKQLSARLEMHGLHFAFLDPYNLKALDFEIIKALSAYKHVDILVHVSTMDLQRNLDTYMASDASAFDSFAPGWREAVGFDRSKGRARGDVFEYWRDIVAATGIAPSDGIKLIKGTRNQRLYWLLIAAKHDLAHKFWNAVIKADRQGTFDF